MSRERAQQIIAHEIPTHRAPDMTSDEIAGRALDALKAENFGLFRFQEIAEQSNRIIELVEAGKRALPVIEACMAAGVFPLDDMTDRRAYDALKSAIAKAEGSGE